MPRKKIKWETNIIIHSSSKNLIQIIYKPRESNSDQSQMIPKGRSISFSHQNSVKTKSVFQKTTVMILIKT